MPAPGTEMRTAAMHVITIPCLYDNFSYLLIDEQNSTGIIIDPVEGWPFDSCIPTPYQVESQVPIPTTTLSNRPKKIFLQTFGKFFWKI